MRANKHLLLWSSVGTIAVLAWAALAETRFADWRVVQERVAAEQAPGTALSIELRQIVVPSLDAADRCTSCHVGMAPGEEGIPGDPLYGKHAPVVHDPADFGCTLCHGGQGRATSTDDAHGRVSHWPEPMIPQRYVWAGCGTCHTHLAVPSKHVLERGRALVERHDCLACHRLDGRGGTLRPGGKGGAEGPDLSYAGARGWKADWYEHHVAAREAPEQELPWRSTFGDLAPGDRATIDEYLLSRVGAPELVEAKALFHSLGCRGCHKVGGVGGDDGPELTRVGSRDPGQVGWTGVAGQRRLENWFKDHFRAPARVAPGSAMPLLGLTERQIDLLTLYMFSLRRFDAPEAWWPVDRLRAERMGVREFATDGATLYGTFCAACHGPSGEGMRYPGIVSFPAIANPDFLAVASDAFITATIQEGRPGRRMPAWGEKQGGLEPEEVARVAAYVRELGGVAAREDARPPRWVTASSTAGKDLFAHNCSGCHGPKGEGGEGPALHNEVLLSSATDTYLVETIRTGRSGTTMLGFGRSSTVRTGLSGGEIEAVVAFLRTWEKREK